jgi:hypothetical protein
MFYVYVHRRATDNKIFYIGKGKGDRAWSKNKRNQFWIKTLNKHGLKVEIICNFYDENDAFKLEVELIQWYGIKNLTNCTYGGEGVSGYKHTKEQRQKRSNYLKNNQTHLKSMLVISSNNKKPIICNNGMMFDSGIDAEKWLKSIGFLKAASTSISACCIGKHTTAYGFQWRFASNNDFLEKKIKTKKVFCSNGMEFESTKDALLWANAYFKKNQKESCIRNCISGLSSSAFGLTWSTNGFPENKFKNREKSVLCDKKIVFKNSVQAEKWLRCNGYPKADKTGITAACKGKHKIRYGHSWEYLNIS